jgi:DNA-binding beta-propeller fold protein YncE
VTPAGAVALFAKGAFSSPASIAGDRNGNFYVANYDKKGFVTRIAPDGTTSILVAPEAGLVQPVGVVVTPDGALLVSWGGDSVARVDMTTGKVIDPHWITNLRNPRQMAFDTYRSTLPTSSTTRSAATTCWHADPADPRRGRAHQAVRPRPSTPRASSTRRSPAARWSSASASTATSRWSPSRPT